MTTQKEQAAQKPATTQANSMRKIERNAAEELRLSSDQKIATAFNDKPTHKYTLNFGTLARLLAYNVILYGHLCANICVSFEQNIAGSFCWRYWLIFTIHLCVCLSVCANGFAKRNYNCAVCVCVCFKNGPFHWPRTFGVPPWRAP